jgi:hypothetical protein
MNTGEPGSALYTKLKAGTALTAEIGGTRIYLEQAPQEATLPYVVLSRIAGSDLYGSKRRIRRYIYAVKAVTMDDLTKAEDIDDELDTMLYNGSLTVAGWGVYWLRRMTDIAYREAGEGGVVYHHRGALYELRLSL